MPLLNIADGFRANVWVVDDSLTQREVIQKSLASHHEVIVFDEVAPMLERLATGARPDLLVLDWHMPVITGLEACKYVRTIADEAELPIMILTATGHHADLLAGLEAGANDFVRKPCEETELHARVVALVRTRRLHSRVHAAEASLREEASFRERFLAILAHDLRQPLNVFALGAKTLAAVDTPQAVRERVRGQFERATGRMQRMIGELLDFSRSRPQGGGMPVVPHDVDLVIVVQELLEEERLAHPDRSFTVDLDESCRGMWDDDRLAQLVSNLVENAVAHSTPASKVRVSLKKVERRVELAVENDGRAIPASTLATIFDPFRRGDDPPRSVRHRGLGLGLYIVQQVAKAHDGLVTVKSDEAGTRFNVSLPIRPVLS